MKPLGLFFFADAPEYCSHESRSWVAHYLRTCRNSKGNRGIKRYRVKRISFGRYTVQLNMTGSPVAVILTRG